MKLLDRLRWLAIESPCPGTADVSAKSCVLLVFVGDTPGTSSARSRKLRPFIGRVCTSVRGTVPAIWLRAVSSRSEERRVGREGRERRTEYCYRTRDKKQRAA